MLHVSEIGTENNQTLIFLHGGGVSSWMWDKQIDFFHDYHILLIDLPEHGESINEIPFTLEGAAKQVIEIIKNKAHKGKAHIIGLSLGAQVIVQMLSMEPEVINSAVVSGTLVRHLKGTKLIKPLLKLNDPFKNLDFMIKANMKNLDVPFDYYEQFKKDTKNCSVDNLTRILSENMNFNIPKELEKATTKTLVLVGEKERAIMHKSAKDLIQTLPNSTGFIVNNMPHNWSLANPELFNNTIKAFIENASLPLELTKI